MVQRCDEDVWRGAPVSAPEAPRQGMRFWVQTGTHWSLGVGHTIGRVTGESFNVACRGARTRHPRSEWATWLATRSAEGQLTLDGNPVVPPSRAHLSASVAVPLGEVERAVEPLVLHGRARRAALRALLVDARFDAEAEADGAYRITVSHATGECAVRVPALASEGPRGSCGEAAGRADGACLHASAVCLRDVVLRGRLLWSIL